MMRRGKNALRRICKNSFWRRYLSIIVISFSFILLFRYSYISIFRYFEVSKGLRYRESLLQSHLKCSEGYREEDSRHGREDDHFIQDFVDADSHNHQFTHSLDVIPRRYEGGYPL